MLCEMEGKRYKTPVGEGSGGLVKGGKHAWNVGKNAVGAGPQTVASLSKLCDTLLDSWTRREGGINNVFRM